MKAISVRQPWADLIIQGKKTLDLRTRKINYRGPIAIHASQIIENEACERFELNPKLLTVGAVIGVVQLVDIFEMEEARYIDNANHHLSHRSYREGLFGWQFEEPKELPKPIMFRGRQGVFNVPDDLMNGSPKTMKRKQAEYRISSPWNPEKPFELRVIPVTDDTKVPYRLSIYHPVVKSVDQQKTFYSHEPPKLVKVVELGGQTLHAVADHVLDALRENDYKPTDLGANRKEPFSLREESGVRLGLLFLAVKPISKFERIEDISQGLRAMTVEELYYWYSKCTSQPAAERAQKALRVLLAAE
jgi:hypothetical protein